MEKEIETLVWTLNIKSRVRIKENVGHEYDQNT